MNAAMHWVFAYGSNMHHQDLCRWLRENDYPTDGILKVRPACLDDHTLVWNYYSKARHGGAANVMPQAGRILYGAALQVDPPTLKAIDHKEGHPARYHRGDRPLPVNLLSGETVPAWLYRVLPAFERPEIVPPRKHYLQIMLAAAKQLNLPEDYLQQLKDIPAWDSVQ